MFPAAENFNRLIKLKKKKEIVITVEEVAHHPQPMSTAVTFH